MGIILLDKRIIFLLIILLFASGVNAPDDLTIPAGEISKDDLILQQAQQNVLATSNISVQLNQIAAQEKENLETALVILLQQQQQMQTTLIITVILVTLASQGLWWAVYLYFQTKGTLPMLKPKLKKETKKKDQPTNLQAVFE